MSPFDEVFVSPARPAPPRAAATITGRLTLLFAFSAGVIVLNLFASQPLVGVIGQSFGLSTGAASLVPTVTMLGYAAGLILLVPVTDLVENRRLVVRTLACDVVALAAAALAPSAAPFLAASLALGATSSVIQMLVPLAASLTPEAHRGRVVGNVMSGVMLGILLSRPIASFVADSLGWRAFFGLSSLLIAALTLFLARILPERRPAIGPRYRTLLLSLWRLMAEEKVLRLRALYAGLCMAAFSVFWTAVALRLAAPPFLLGQRGIGLFALAGAAAVFVTPIAGRAGDRGWTRPAAFLAHLSIVLAMLLAGIAGAGWAGFDPVASPDLSLGLLVAAAFLLDLGVAGDQTLGRRAINLLRPEARGRVNGLFTGTFFVFGAAGAALAGFAWAFGGWTLVCLAGIGLGIVTLAIDLVGRPGAGER